MANFWNGKPICRICLKVLGNSECSYVNEDNIKEMIMYSVPEVDIYASEDPVICLVCRTMLVNVYNFKKKCINTEVILRTYRTRHHIDEDDQVDLSKLIEELVRFNSYFNQQQFNKSLSVPFPPPAGTPDMICAENAVDSNKNNIIDENLTSPRCTEFDRPQIIDANILFSEIPPPQQSAPAHMELPLFNENQFDSAAGNLNDDATIIPPNVPNIPQNMSESNKHLLQNFPMHFMASSQLAHLNQHHLVNSNQHHMVNSDQHHLVNSNQYHFVNSNQHHSVNPNQHHLVNPNQHHLVNLNHNHPMNQRPFAPHVPNRFVYVNHNQLVNMPRPQMVNGNQDTVNIPVRLFNPHPNNSMQNVMVPLVINQKPGNVPIENFRYVPPSSLNRPMVPFYHPRGACQTGPMLNVNDFAKNVVVRPPAVVSEVPPKPREKTTEQRPTEGMKVLKVVLKRKLETHPIESKKRLVVELERCKLIPSDPQSENDRSSESNQKLFQCVGCMYMTTSSRFFTEHMKKCVNAPKENNTNTEWKCMDCHYTTSDQMDLDEHVKSLHVPPRELFSCRSCRFVTADKILLIRHETVDRSKCPKCNHLFCSEENLQKHMERHERNTCPFCAYSPADRSNLRRHIYSHSPEQIPCEFCDYRHPSPHVLRTHLKKYHNSVGIEDLDYKPNMSIEELIQDIKALLDASK